MLTDGGEADGYIGVIGLNWIGLDGGAAAAVREEKKLQREYERVRRREAGPLYGCSTREVLLRVSTSTRAPSTSSNLKWAWAWLSLPENERERKRVMQNLYVNRSVSAQEDIIHSPS